MIKRSLNRRDAIGLLGGAGFSVLAGPALLNAPRLFAADPSCLSCVAKPSLTEGPYFVDERLNRSDIRIDPSDGSLRPGVRLDLAVTVYQLLNGCCSPLSGVNVDIWHCDAGGLYSDESANGTAGKKYLRGYQISDTNGKVSFTTVYPGWYQGRTVHIHFKIRTFDGTQKSYEFTSQLFFDDSFTDQVYAQAPYNSRGARDTRNSNDGIYSGASDDGTVTSGSGTQLMLAPVKNSNGDGYQASFDVGLKIVPSKPSIASANSVVNAAGFQPGIAPGSLITIYGSDFAAVGTNHSFNASTDAVDGKFPTTLAGTSVSVNGKSAFPYYVSPGQLNVLAPDDSFSGVAPVIVSNSSGSSDPMNVSVQPLLPAFFQSAQSWILAVRADGKVIGSTTTVPTQGGPGGPGAPGGPGGPGGGSVASIVPAKPGDVLQLFGTGFGPADPAVSAGKLFSTAVPLASPVTVTIGSSSANVAFAGLSAPGVNQVNITVPALADGDYDVVAVVAGVQTKSGLKIRIQNA